MRGCAKKPYQCTVTATDERVQIDWQCPLSGVHSIMMVNSAQPTQPNPTSFHSIYHHVVERTLQLRGQIHSAAYFCSTLFCSVGGRPRFSLIYGECCGESSLLILPIFAHRPKGYTHIVSGFKYQPKWGGKEGWGRGSCRGRPESLLYHGVLALEGVLPSLAEGEWSGRCDLYCGGLFMVPTRATALLAGVGKSRPSTWRPR